MQFDPKLTLDGLMTLVAGMIAFVAVVLQIRSSSRQVREQLDAEHESRREEQKRQSRAVARAVLFEIDVVYGAIVREVGSQNISHPFEPPRFVVYESNTARIGDLGEDVASPIVRFCGAVSNHFSISRQYAEQYRDQFRVAASASLGDPRILACNSIKAKYDDHLQAATNLEGLARKACRTLVPVSQVSLTELTNLKVEGSGP